MGSGPSFTGEVGGKEQKAVDQGLPGGECGRQGLHDRQSSMLIVQHGVEVSF